MATDIDVIVSDEEDTTPALVIGSTWFWQDDNHDWQTVEVIDCEPKGWGWCCIKWHTPSGWHTKSVPVIKLVDLDTYLDMQPDYGMFEAADTDCDFDDYHDRRALTRMGYGD